MSTPKSGEAAPRSRNFIRGKQLETKDGLKTSTRFKLISEGKYPKPVKLGPRMSAWIEDEVDAWIAERIAARGQQQAGRISRRDQGLSA